MEEEKKRQKEAEANGGTIIERPPVYPKQVFFIIGNEFCERFSYYGMKAILVIYFKSKLGFTEDYATVIYHTFSLFCYFTPILGALIADQFLGKYRTIIYISVIYIIGQFLEALSAAKPPIDNMPQVELSMLGLALIALGTGGIKPCVSAFGGDQFKLPKQERELQTFFSVFYFAINIGALASTFVTPILRQDVKCFDSDDNTCYPLAFGVPAVLMLVATIILILGKPLYTITSPQGNVLPQVCGGIWHSLMSKFRSSEKHDHWMDAAKEKYDPSLMEDTKVLLRVLLLFVPLPIFWALFDQQGSRWTFQATRMNGQLGSYIIKPDQMQLVNAAFILALIPLFDGIIYPLFAKVNLLVKPLPRIVVGGLLAALAFFLSGIVELNLQKTYDHIPAVGESHLHFMNSFNCHLVGNLKSGDFDDTFQINATSNHIIYGLKNGSFELNVRSDCPAYKGEKKIQFDVDSKKVKAIFAFPSANNEFSLYDGILAEEPKKTENTYPKLRVLFGIESAQNQTLFMKRKGYNETESLGSSIINDNVAESNYTTIEPDTYTVYYGDANGKELGSFDFLQGGVYTLAVTDEKDPQINIFKLTSENSLHMLWLVPQYFVLTAGEVMFSITGLEFSYSQAPATMKSVVQAAWLLTVAFGNLIVIIVAEAKSEGLSQSSEFFMFGCLMVVDMLIFGWLARLYNREDAKRKLQGIENKAAESISMEERNDHHVD